MRKISVRCQSAVVQQSRNDDVVRTLKLDTHYPCPRAVFTDRGHGPWTWVVYIEVKFEAGGSSHGRDLPYSFVRYGRPFYIVELRPLSIYRLQHGLQLIMRV